MKRLTLFILPFVAVVLLLPACGGEKKPEPDPEARQQVNIPLSKEQSGLIQPVEVPAEKLPDLSKLSEVEASIFRRTVGLQIPYYEILQKWADEANTITTGEAAAVSLRQYLNIQNDFARSMQRLDMEFAGKIDPEYAGSAAFEVAVDEYMNDPQLMKRTEYIMGSYTNLMQRFKDDPACKEFFAEVERLARESQ
ncbi:MAG: hypothetical protein KFF77_04095 [Bacteroidetes bacterium]|nr:hypothetical protein [Bacteroidota bacterium]